MDMDQEQILEFLECLESISKSLERLADRHGADKPPSPGSINPGP